MYKRSSYHQFGLDDFNQPAGFKMNLENRWVRKAETIPWAEIEDKYAELFPSNTGMPAKPLRMALGSLLIQKQLGFSDRELVEELRENPYFQYFIGLPGYQDRAPFAPSLLVEFRKRLTDEILGDINEMIIEYNEPKDPPASGDSSNEQGSDSRNSGTMILDATCAPQNIEYPQDINLLNESRENLEEFIDYICYVYNTEKPRMYRQLARRDYLNLARSKRRSKKKIRTAIRKQLQYIRRDRGYLASFLKEGKELTDKQMARLKVIDKVYEQQKYMYDNDVRSVEDRIVSISQPYIRPIVRGKAAAPVEFGAKFDMSLDSLGMARIEKLSFDAYNENEVLQTAAENYKRRTGKYPERILADKIYRNRNNLSYCRERGIRLSGPALGRPPKNQKIDRKLEYIDNADRVAVERAFSLAKRCFGLGRIRTKLDHTTRSSIALSVIAMNIDRLTDISLAELGVMDFSRFKWYRSSISCLFIINADRVEISAGY